MTVTLCRTKTRRLVVVLDVDDKAGSKSLANLPL